MAPERREPEPTHQKPYPHTIVDHLTQAIAAHDRLTVPPEDDDTSADGNREGGRFDERAI